MKRIYVIAFILISVLCLKAQSGKGKEMHRQIEAHKVSFITQKLDLTPEEAQLFWPLYNEMQKKKHELNVKMNSIHGCCKSKNKDICSDKEILAKCDSILDCEKAFVDLKIEYFNKYKKILSAQKVHKLLNIEKDFNRRLLRRLRKGRGHYKK